MIRSLRTTHRTVFALAGPLLGLLFVFGLRARSERMELRAQALGEDRSVPEGMQSDAPSEPALSITEGGAWSLVLPQDWNAPDVLVYATAEVGANPGSGLPADARLLGRARTGSLTPLPGETHGVLYSLAHQEVLAWLAPGELPPVELQQEGGR